jgi:DNA invertase Pin-like site-specific DNA recombinase
VSDKILPHHLGRKAVLYVRQSSPFQVANHTEGQALQYAMRDRLRGLGWNEVEVIDEDLGRSAAGCDRRAGFERMVAEVCLGRVGAVAALEVSRFARNSRDWQRLVEVCRVVDALLIDQETIYSPRHGNDRLLLGLKGSLNEYELDLFRQRSVEARRAKARRGELVVAAPVGYLRTEDQRLEMDPDRRVQEAVRLVFRKFVELGTVRQTLLWFLEEGLDLPTRTAGGETLWRRPTYAAVLRFFTNPAYGGTYAYGKTEAVVRYTEGAPRKGLRRKAPGQWLALIPEAHEGYVSWEEFQRYRQAIADNVNGTATGAAKHGAALLAGLLRCGRCGRKLTVHYTGRGHDVLRYACLRGHLDQGQPRCIAFGGISVDAAVGRQLVAVVRPAAVEAAMAASRDAERANDEVVAALGRDLEAARYAARRAERQYHAVDPDNRLVAQELEDRWDRALARVRELERQIEQQRVGRPTTPSIDEEVLDLAADLGAVWDDPGADGRLKKRIVRALIQEVVADVDAGSGEIILVIHWKGGVHTELRLPRRRRGQCTATSKDVVAAVRVLARICTDRVIAGVLNRNGLRTGRGNRWTAGRVVTLRNWNDIPVHAIDRQRVDGWMNLTDAAAFLGIAANTLRLAVEQGRVPGEHPLADGPWVFRRADLETDSARQVVERARRQAGTPGSAPAADDSPSLFSELRKGAQ